MVATVRILARIQSKPSSARDAPPVARDEISLQVGNYDEGRRIVLDQLPDGWIVASWTVEYDEGSG